MGLPWWLVVRRDLRAGAARESQQLIHPTKTRLLNPTNAPLIAVGTLVAVGTFRLRNNP
jgi:hypothetical protein